jgi:hypothetical protein
MGIVSGFPEWLSSKTRAHFPSQLKVTKTSIAGFDSPGRMKGRQVAPTIERQFLTIAEDPWQKLSLTSFKIPEGNAKNGIILDGFETAASKSDTHLNSATSLGS